MIETALTQGIWAALSIALIFYILKAQEKRDVSQGEREKNYQNIIEALSTGMIEEMNEVKIKMIDLQGSVNEIKKSIKEGE